MKEEGKKENYDKKIGAVFIIIAAFFFSLMALFVRLSGDLPTMQKAFFRNIVAVALSMSAVLRTKEKFQVKKGCFLPLVFRGLFGTAGMLLNFWVIDRLGIADANMLGKMAPFFAVILSCFILREKVGKMELMTVLAAIIGAVFVMKPTTGLASIPALAGLLGGFCAGMAYTLVRKLGLLGERREMIVFFFSALSTLVTLPAVLFWHSPMTILQFLYLILAGCSAAAAQFAVTYAYSKARAKDNSVYDYSQVIFAALWGILFFGELPDMYSFIGYIIIIGAAIMKWRMGREN